MLFEDVVRVGFGRLSARFGVGWLVCEGVFFFGVVLVGDGELRRGYR